MFNRSFCYSLSAIAGILLSSSIASLYGWFFLLLSATPHIVLSLRRKRFSPNLLLVFLCLIVFYFLGIDTLEKKETILKGDETSFTGSIFSEPVLTSSNQWSFQLEIATNERIQIFLPFQEEPPLYRELCNVKGVLSTPLMATNPHGFDYKYYLHNQGIYWIISNPKNVDCTSQQITIINKLVLIRKKGVEKLLETGNVETSSFIAALVFGEKKLISEATLLSYRQLGIIHLLAVSGLHVGMVTFAFFYLLCRFGMTRERASIIMFCTLPFYIILAGGAPSVIRASIMTMAFLSFSMFQVKIKPIEVLSLLFILFLLIRPNLLYHLGFQLSFLTSFAILLSQQLLSHHYRIVTLMKVTVVAQLTSLPLTIYHFYEISLLTILVNIFFIPFISMWILPLSFLTVILSYLVPPLSTWSYFLVNVSLQITHTLFSSLSTMDWHVIVFGKPTVTVIIILYIAIFLFFICVEYENMRFRLWTAILIFVILAYQILHPYFNPYATITMLDVGQGDSIIVELPYRREVYVIDTGGKVIWGTESNGSGPGKKVIEPFLKGEGIKNIDRLILTHGHLDHMGDACYVVSRFSVDEVLYPKGNTVAEEAIPTLKCLQERGNKISFVKEGTQWGVEKDRFIVLNPTGMETEENNRSIVLLSIIEGVTFLFTGDIEEATEKRLVKTYDPLKINILKISHHGSKTSSTEQFLQHTEPSLAIVPVGRNNRFGHPHPDVIERLSKKNIHILQTDIHGAVEIKVKDKKVKVKTMLQVD